MTIKRIIPVILSLLIPLSIYSQGISGVDISNEYSEYYDFSKAQKSNMITHSYSQTIDPSTSVSCNDGFGVHYANSYYRVFDLFDFFNLNSNCIIDSIEIGIALANSGNSNEQPVFFNFYSLSSFNDNAIIIVNDSLVPLCDTLYTSVFNTESGTHKMIDVVNQRNVRVVKGKYLVIEIGLPYEEESGHSLFIGSNNLGESGKTFIKASHASCGVDEPLAVEELLYDMHMILNVFWKYEDPVPEIFSFNVEGQIVNTVITDEPDYRIDVVMAPDTSLTDITPDITIAAGFQIIPASGISQDFSSGPVTYNVNNEFTKVSQTWDAYVTNAGPDIISASLSQANDDIIIDKINHTVTIPVNVGTDISALEPSFVIHSNHNFLISPESGSEQDFSSGPVTYTVYHETLPLTQDWDVSVIETVTAVKTNYYKEINIYPNPFQGYIYLKDLKPVKSEVYDLSGKLILVIYEKMINMSRFPEGMYFIKIYTEEYIYTDKLILRK